MLGALSVNLYNDMRILIILLLCTLPLISNAQVVGKWKTVDDQSGKIKSIVEIMEKSGKIYGTILEVFPDPGDDPDPVCEECDKDDPRYMKRIIGMEIIKDMEKDGDEYSGGNILDPENGNVYRCKIWVGDDGKLKVRGYVAFLYRTQTWLPYEG